MLSAAAFVGVVVLAIASVAILGVPLGILASLLTYGLFHRAARALLRHIGDSGDAYQHERHPIPSRRARK